MRLIYFRIINDQIAIARSHTLEMPKEIADCKAELVYNDEQFIKKYVECKLIANTIRHISYNNKIIKKIV